MIKSIPVEQLRRGMYVHSMNRDWIDHPFLRSRFRLEDNDQIKRIRELGVSEVEIDTGLGLDVPSAAAQSPNPGLDAVARHQPPEFHPTTLAEERARARKILREARQVAEQLMDDARLGRQVNLHPAREIIARLVASVVRNQDALLGLSRIRSVDHYTFEHSVHVSVLMIAFARCLGLDRAVIEEVGLGALLHDVGKCRIPESILNKPGKLTDAEFEIIRGHVIQGQAILAESTDISTTALDVIAEHHERIDGSGYPEAKTGPMITRYGQMASIIDVYDALTTQRVYHNAMSPHEALRHLLQWSPQQFDRVLVQQFIRCVGIYPIGTLVRLESQRLAVVAETGREHFLKPIVRLIFDTKAHRRLQPQDIDLSCPTACGQDPDHIVDVEDPSQWGLRPEFLLR